jgi:hypothetical protein
MAEFLRDDTNHSLIIKRDATGTYLDGPVADELSVSTTLLQAIMSGSAPWAEYHFEQQHIPLHFDGTGIKGLKSGSLTFDLANVRLEYTQTGPAVKVSDHPEMEHHAFAPFKLVNATWKVDPHA